MYATFALLAIVIDVCYIVWTLRTYPLHPENENDPLSGLERGVALDAWKECAMVQVIVVLFIIFGAIVNASV